MILIYSTDECEIIEVFLHALCRMMYDDTLYSSCRLDRPHELTTIFRASLRNRRSKGRTRISRVGVHRFGFLSLELFRICLEYHFWLIATIRICFAIFRNF